MLYPVFIIFVRRQIIIVISDYILNISNYLYIILIFHKYAARADTGVSVADGTAAVEAGHGQQRDPPPYLTAQIRRQYRHDGPYRLPLHHAQHHHQRQMGHQRIETPQQRHVGHAVHRGLHQQYNGHAAPVVQQPLLRPRNIAEGGGQDHSENAHHRVVQQIYGIPQRLVGQRRRSVHHKNTCFRLNTYSKYRSLISENLPWGMGISVRHAICKPRQEML